MPLLPATEKFIQQASASMEEHPVDWKNLSIKTYREMNQGYKQFMGSIAEGISINKISIPVAKDSAEIEARIFSNGTEGVKPALIYIPGGGFIAYLDCHDSACSIMAKGGECKVIMIMPRLAPEFKAPIPLQDSIAAIHHIFTHADEFNIDCNNISLGGDSSGANLALGAALTFIDNNSLPAEIKSLQLVSGTYDLSMSLDNKYREHESKDLFPEGMFDYMFSLYVDPSIAWEDPSVSPYFRDLSRLPPTHLIVSEYDGVRHQTEELFNKMEGQSVNVKKTILLGQTHSALLLRHESAMPDGDDPAEAIGASLLSLSHQNRNGITA